MQYKQLSLQAAGKSGFYSATAQSAAIEVGLIGRTVNNATSPCIYIETTVDVAKVEKI